MKKFIRFCLNKFGFSLVKNKFAYANGQEDKQINTMLGGLLRSKLIGINPSTIIDVGAAQGTWTEKSMPLWPTSKYILVEPLEERKSDLESLKQKASNIDTVYSALGKQDGTVTFSIYKDFDGSGIGINDSGYVIGKREVVIRSTDSIVNELNLKGPFLIKLDTHGFEIPILEGALQTLKETELIIIEVYGFKISDNALLHWQMCQYLDSVGFRLFDMVDIMRREKDSAFWQCDVFFLKKDHPLFLNNNYI